MGTDSTIHIETRASPRKEPPENVKAVVTRLDSVFEDVQQYKRLLSHRDSEAQQVLDMFKMVGPLAT
jgi:streptomycin 6-kinase